MFDAVRNNRKIVQIFLVLITIPFGLWGVDSYLRGSSGEDTVATIGSVKISEAELTENIRNRREQLRQQQGESFDQAITETPEFRNSVLESLIVRRALLKRVEDARLGASEAQMQHFIQSNFPEFQENGKFSLELYRNLLRSSGRSEQQFERDIRQDLALRSLITPIVKSAVAPTPSLERWLTLLDEERQVSEVALNAKSFESQVSLAPDAAQKYYDANQRRYETPEQFKLEYAELKTDQLARSIEISDAESRKWYDEHIDRYKEPEERRASHILIEPGKDDAAAKAKAEALRAKVVADPSSFAKVAKQESADVVSAEHGGDLDFFGRNAMVKEFEDAAFKLKLDEISSVVKTEHGYHIIRLTGIRGGKARPFEAVKGEIVEELRKTAAAKKFAESAEQFSNVVYEQADSFKPAAEKLPVNVVTTDWIPAGVKQQGVLGNDKLRAAYQSAEAIKNRRNSEAVDVGNGTLVSVRVVDHKPAAQKPFDEVKAQIEAELLAAEARKVAQSEGEARLAKLNAGDKVDLAWSEAKAAKRGNGVLSAEAQKAVFGAKTDKLPVYVGASTPGGYTLYRIDKVNLPTITANDGRIAELRGSYAQAMADADVRAFIRGLRERAGAKVLPQAAAKPQE